MFLVLLVSLMVMNHKVFEVQSILICHSKVFEGYYYNCPNIAIGCVLNKAVQEVSVLCSNHTTCFGFSYSESAGHGCLKPDSNCTAIRTNSNYDFYVKGCSSDNIVKVWNDKFLNCPTIGGKITTDLTSMKAQCNSNIDCVGFSWNGASGYLKTLPCQSVIAGPYAYYAKAYATISSNPTSSPTQITQFPTPFPTFSPTLSPILTPSLTPTSAPTFAPSQAPTLFPTISPSTYPTYSPTNVPSISPSSPPTKSPSTSPIIDPTTAPTHGPSIAPSISPIINPTTAPTYSPSIAPTDKSLIIPQQTTLVDGTTWIGTENAAENRQHKSTELKQNMLYVIFGILAAILTVCNCSIFCGIIWCMRNKKIKVKRKYKKEKSVSITGDRTTHHVHVSPRQKSIEMVINININTDWTQGDINDGKQAPANISDRNSSSDNESLYHVNETDVVRKWLNEMSECSQYFDNFMDNGYTKMDVIVDISDETVLKYIGINLLEHRVKIMDEINKLKDTKQTKTFGNIDTGNV